LANYEYSLGRVQLVTDWLSKNFLLRGCPVNPNEVEFFLLTCLANRSPTGRGRDDVCCYVYRIV